MVQPAILLRYTQEMFYRNLSEKRLYTPEKNVFYKSEGCKEQKL